MAKIGDRVRFLNATGGGVIRKIEGKTVIVEDEDGFETPILLKDVVVVLPAGHEAVVKSANIMFDQKAFDEGKKEHKEIKEKPISTPETSVLEEKDQPVEETDHGDSPNILLAFEPDNLKRLGDTKFAGVLVNDSNYFIDFTFLKRSVEDRGWEVVFRGTVNPNELIDVVVVKHEDLSDYEKVALQGIVYKQGKAFALMPPLNVTRKLDLTKFHKLHCFRESKYFEGQVLEFPLVTSGDVVAQPEVDVERLNIGLKGESASKQMQKELSDKYRKEISKGNQRNKETQRSWQQGVGVSPTKKLPLIEVDLHIGELIDTLAGMEPKDILEVQLNEVRKTMGAHSRRIGQKIVFIHGKGEGVLRNAVIDLLKKEYPKAELQDASFREYGFGATLVTVH